MEPRGGEIAPLLRQLRQAALAPRPQDPRPRPADRDPPRLLPEQRVRRPQLAARVGGLEHGPRAGERLQQTADLQHALGLMLCILPGIYLAVGYVFALPLVIDKKMEFWTAMEVSRRVVHKHWWSMLALVIVLALVAFAGVLLCGVGALITIPVSSAAFMYIYEDLFGGQAAVQS